MSSRLWFVQGPNLLPAPADTIKINPYLLRACCVRKDVVALLRLVRPTIRVLGFESLVRPKAKVPLGPGRYNHSLNFFTFCRTWTCSASFGVVQKIGLGHYVLGSSMGKVLSAPADTQLKCLAAVRGKLSHSLL